MNVELLGVVKSTWNLKRLSELEDASSRKKLGSPAGGGMDPSRSEGKKDMSAADLGKSYQNERARPLPSLSSGHSRRLVPD